MRRAMGWMLAMAAAAGLAGRAAADPATPAVPGGGNPHAESDHAATPAEPGLVRANAGRTISKRRHSRSCSVRAAAQSPRRAAS